MSNNTQHKNGDGNEIHRGNIKNESKSLKFFYTNAESLSNKWQEFRTKIEDEKPDIISIVETWFKPNTLTEEINLEGYKAFFHHTDQVRGELPYT